ncbi:MAG TPA: M13 family metallopeptidase [Candidatus Saccharimonadales bacterium]|nr:M13 family metallopeptidase [Candidatus Saccharimonadales bacterium]
MTKLHSMRDYGGSLSNSVRPQDDFYSYVNSKWLKENPIPPTESRWGTFLVLRDKTWQDMRAIYNDLQEKKLLSPNSVEQQARDLYYTIMHVDDFSKDHLKLVDSYLKRIDEIKDLNDLATVIGELQAIGISGPWRAMADMDDKDSTRYLFRLGQGGLTLPSRDYYLEDKPEMKAVRKAYTAHLAKVFKRLPGLGESADNFSKQVIDFETSLARHSLPSAELRDVEKNYNKVTFTKLKAGYPNINWPAYASSLGWRPGRDLSVDQPKFLAYVDKLFIESKLESWKTYLKWKFVVTYYSKIDESFAKLRFEFFGKTLTGSRELMPKWQRAVMLIDAVFGQGVGRLYAKRYFPESSKRQILEMVETIRATYKERLKRLKWMDPKTKPLAYKKLANMKVLIGYPDKWRDFSKLEINRESLIGNLIAIERFQNDYYLDRLHKKTSRDEWLMDPQTVNAYHDPNRLVICFPAAILQSPFFDPKAPIVANLAGIGTVIGHELTHGFDDQGCLFDDVGNMRIWQTKKDRAEFAKRAKIIIDQADQFEVLPGLHLIGQLIIGESIADLGGLEIAYETFKKLPKQQQVGEGKLTAEQLFFVAYATTECDVNRPERVREFALRDPHPESRFRVNGMVTHVDGFYDAFRLSENDRLYRPAEKRTKIW